MSNTIESLELEILSNSKSAVNGIDKLTQSLGKLKNATKGGLGLSAVSKQLGTVGNAVNKVTAANNKSAKSFVNFGAKITVAFLAIKKVLTTLKSFVTKSSDYIENMNLFTVAMGGYASAAKDYANTVSDVMGIDTGDWMRNQGVFQTLATGFGVAGDQAAIMSKNLTQLGYDISSFYNLDIGDAMEKLQSGLAGELEPLRRIGYDLSQAKLEATAAELGIDKAVSSMTQAEKAMLRYYAIMTQVTTVQGDMARTLDQPANQMRVLKAQLEMLGREIGNVFMPLLQKLLPYGIAITKVLREIVSGIAGLTGFEMPEIADTGIDSLASGSEDTASALDDAAKAAKKLKSYTLGFDELNVINPDSESTDGDSAIGAFDFELPEYNFLGNATNERIEGIIAQIKELLEPIERLIDKTVDWAKELDLEPISESFGNMSSSIKMDLAMVGDVFDWVYTEVLLPLAEWVIESGLPAAFNVIAEAARAVYNVLKPVIEGIKELKPVLEPIISWVGDVVITILEEVAGVFEKLAQVFTERGDDIKGIITGIGEILGTLWVILQPIIETIIPNLKGAFKTLGDFLATIVNAIIDVLGGIVDFVAGVLTGDWERAWDGIVAIFSGIWDAVVGIVDFAWENIKSSAKTSWNSITKFFEPIGKWFKEKVIDPVVGFFKGLWDSVSGFFENLWKDIKAIWKAVATWFDEKVIQPVVNFFAPIVETISQFFYGCWLIIQAVWVTVSTWFDTNVIQPIVDFFKTVWIKVSGFFVNLWGDIKAVWVLVSTWFNEKVITPVVNFFEGVWTSVAGFFTSLWEDIKGVWNAVSTWFEDTIITPVKDAFKIACEAIGEFFSNLWLGIRQGVAKAMNGVISGIESAINWIIDGINGLVGGFNKVVQWAADVLDKDWGGVNLVQKVSFNRIVVPTYADGGFPDQGQMFVAREAGPEMVGNIGRRAAVVNNDQIVESIAIGVSDANSEQNALLREQNSLLRALLEKDSGVYLDGRSLSESVNKYKREQGRELIVGGVL